MIQILKLGHKYQITHSRDTVIENKVGREKYESPVISFQDGPIKENGLNGIRNEDLLEVLIDRLEYLQEKDDGRYACPENYEALINIKLALRRLNARTKDRIKRGVEGTNKA